MSVVLSPTLVSDDYLYDPQTARTCLVTQTHSTFGDGAFAAASPGLWNSLPPHLRDADLPYSRFRRSLETFLSGLWGHDAVRTTLTAPSRKSYLLNYLLWINIPWYFKSLKHIKGYREAPLFLVIRTLLQYSEWLVSAGCLRSKNHCLWAGWKVSRQSCLGLETVLRRIFSVLVLNLDVLVLRPNVLVMVLRKMFSTSVASNVLTA